MDERIELDFTGQRVVVVGASRGGLGTAIAAGFARNGAAVTITGIEPEPIYGPELPYVTLDVTDADAVGGFADRLDAVDVVVNCAGIVRGPDECEVPVFHRVLEVNTVGHYVVAQAMRRPLSARGGSLIGVASMFAQFGSPITPGYGASKAAIVQLTKSLAIAWAPDGVRVNAIAPGFIVTEQTGPLREIEGKVDEITARTPAGRWGRPDDLVGPTLFLASPLAAFITGVTLAVDGGYGVA